MYKIGEYSVIKREGKNDKKELVLVREGYKDGVEYTSTSDKNYTKEDLLSELSAVLDYTYATSKNYGEYLSHLGLEDTEENKRCYEGFHRGFLEDIKKILTLEELKELNKRVMNELIELKK